MNNFFRNLHKTVIRPIPDVKFPSLIALDLVPEDQQGLLRSCPEIIQTSRLLGKTQFCLHQAQDYVQRSWALRHFLWLLMLVICATVNIQAVRATIDNSLPPQWYLVLPFITFFLSLFLIGLLDWLIGSELKNYLCRIDARRIEQKLSQEVNTARGEIDRAFALGKRQDAYERVQEKYLSAEKRLPLLKLGFLAVIYLVEIIAALYSVTIYGESHGLTAYIAPLVGVLFSGLSGFYRGITIEYARRRHHIGYHYLNLAEEQSFVQLTQQIEEANQILETFVKNGKIEREVVENIRHNTRTTQKQADFLQQLNEITEDYHSRESALTKEYRQDLTHLEEQQEERENQDRSVQSPERKQLSFKRSKNRLGRKHLNAQLSLIEETEHRLKSLYRQYPAQNQGECPFSRELVAKKEDIQTQLSRLNLESQVLKNVESPRSPDSFHSSQDDHQENPFDSP
jgi:hypothetical protein